MSGKPASFPEGGVLACASLALVSLFAPWMFAYKPAEDSAGPLTVSIGAFTGERERVIVTGTPIRIGVVLENHGTSDIRGVVRLKVIDQWKVLGADSRPFGASANGQAVTGDWVKAGREVSQPFEASANGRARLNFRVIAGKGTYSAYYPIHAFAEFDYGGQHLTAHPILMLETRLADAPRGGWQPEWKPAVVPANGALGLWHLAVRRVQAEVVQDEPPAVAGAVTSSLSGLRDQFGIPVTQMNMGVSPLIDVSGTRVQFGTPVTLGATREAVSLRLGPGGFSLPPLVGGLMGMIWGALVNEQAPLPPDSRAWVKALRVEYPLALPATTPLVLRFANAVGDAEAGRGAMFRVRVLPFDGSSGEAPQVLYQQAIQATAWQESHIDLSSFAGRSIRLQLEAQADSSEPVLAYWAEPSIIAGVPALPPAFPPAAGAPSRLLGVVERQGTRYEVRLYPGQRGLLDPTVGFVSGSASLYMHGFHVRVLGDALEDSRSVCRFLEAREEPTPGRYRVRHRFGSPEGDFDVLGEDWIENGALRTHFWLENTPPARPWFNVHLEEVATGQWSEKATRVYAGDGNVIQDPEAFQLTGTDGHAESTSFVGLDFANGISVVQGVDAPPEWFKVDSAARYYSLRTPGPQTVTLIPSPNVWEAARVWHDLNGLHASGGVHVLAGRFTFDGGRNSYRVAAQNLQRAFLYGLTDSIVVWHSWQRWGYDYRLPDIYPPNPEMGTLADFVNLVQTCTNHGVLFAPHDNYTDLYPDAEDFSYDDVTFNPVGQPVRAYPNRAWGGSQSYRLRADQAHQFIARNLKLIRAGFAPTAYFLDVLTAYSPTDFFDADGKYFDRLYDREAQRQEVAFIRDYLGNDAPVISEAGHDQLIGWLDGGQVQHLRVDASAPAGASVWRIKCSDTERVPWYDMAHHDRFILQGAGYPSRYVGGLDREEHGGYSDDYISTEVMTGHPAMVSAAFSRDTVRVYWLLHDVGRALAMRRMEGFQFDGANLHRQHVSWEGGGEVYVNRGADNWTVAGHTLPQYGFYARVPGKDGVVETAIELRDGQRVEWSRSGSMAYENARNAQAGAYRLTKAAEGLVCTPLPDSGRLSVRIRWSELPWKLKEPRTAQALDEAGKVLRSVPVKAANGIVVLDCDPAAFAYMLR
jgi:hypothetical protein